MTQRSSAAVLGKIFPLPVPKPFKAALARLLGIQRAEELYGKLLSTGGCEPLMEKLLRDLEIACRTTDRDLAGIPRRGPTALVANHPYGILDGAVLASMLLRIRPDVKFLANPALSLVPELREVLIPIDPAGGTVSTLMNGRGLRKALDFLAAGGLLAVFPAGEVAHFQWKQRAITDGEWNPAITRLIAIAARRVPALAVVPAHVTGANSLFFQALGLVHARLRTALLIRELLNKRRCEVEVRIGQPIPAGKLLALPSHRERMQYLRWRSQLLACREAFKPETALPFGRRRPDSPEPTLAPRAADALLRDIHSLSPLLESGEFRVFLAPAESLPAVLPEIGRLRETAFRAAGEGSGKTLDLDRFDPHYLHLFLWDARRRAVAGAYRIGLADRITARLGVSGLYTASLFEYGQEFLTCLGPALELGRSFITPEYQRAFAPLLLLWKGIGRYIARNPQYKVLFGPVSISNRYRSVSRSLMVSFLERHLSLRAAPVLVASRRPFRPRRANGPRDAGWSVPGLDIDDLSAAIADIEPTGAGVPVLLRQYVKLGGKLLGFNVDPQFADALDGLILVDLTRTKPKVLERYLGAAEAAAFLRYHEMKR